MRIVMAVLVGLVALIGLPWLLLGNDFFLYRMFAPKYEQVRRETFEQTKAYRQGMVQELQNMRFQYVQADEAHKVALASVILHRTADFPESDLPDDLRTFLRELRSAQ